MRPNYQPNIARVFRCEHRPSREPERGSAGSPNAEGYFANVASDLQWTGGGVVLMHMAEEDELPGCSQQDTFIDSDCRTNFDKASTGRRRTLADNMFVRSMSTPAT